MNPTSSGVREPLIDTTTPSASMMPNRAKMNSGQFFQPQPYAVAGLEAVLLAGAACQALGQAVRLAEGIGRFAPENSRFFRVFSAIPVNWLGEVGHVDFHQCDKEKRFPSRRHRRAQIRFGLGNLFSGDTIPALD